MKKIGILVAFFGFATIASAQSTFAINFDVGVLSNNVGAPLSQNALIQVIASPDAVFDAPTDSAFVGGNDQLLFSWAFDSDTSGMDGVASFEMTVNLSQFNVVGQFLTLRWFPTLTTMSSAPGFSTFYGEFGYNQDSSWVAPAAGNIIGLQMLTLSSGGGALADAVGQATSMTPVPEPSTYAAIFGALALGFVAYRRRQAVSA